MESYKIERNEAVAEEKLGKGMGKKFPWVATIYAGGPEEFTLTFRTIENATEAIKAWQAQLTNTVK